MDIRAKVASPLTNRLDAIFTSAVSTAHIIEQYRKQFEIDVTEYFEGIPQIGIYECPETGFRFYHPASIAGKDTLYQQLGRFPWFYQEGKWEHATALQHIHEGQHVLDIGCGTGQLLLAAKNTKGAQVTGIELNPDSAKAARTAGLFVVDELIEEHVRTRSEFYDIVCTFQVLEHIPQAGRFITACLEALKPGGIFIVGVPNNDSFLKFDPNAVLNGPPHHMGLWSRQSLSALTRLFPMEVIRFEIEPLNTFDWYQSVMESHYLPERWARSLFYRIGGAKRFRQYIVDNASTIAGHTILVAYRKIS